MEYTASSSSSTMTRISPVFLLIIVILAVVFFLAGLLHLLIRFLMKRSSSSSIHHSNRFPDASGSHSLQRQLQQLFRLHDSGLDQASIDALPVFFYKEIMGLKEPFDCAVCLCEFSDQDQLRLLPLCSHAFHIHCIDTWLLSNSTCPLCRSILHSSGLSLENPLFCLESCELSNRFPSDGDNGFSCNMNPPQVIMEEAVDQKRVLPVRLGKFRSVIDGEESAERARGESSSCNLDARRCYSLGSFRYVVGESNLRVALSGELGGGGSDAKFAKVRGYVANSAGDGDVEGKKISSRSKGESFSVSKVWLWSKKSKFHGYSNAHMGIRSSLETFNDTAQIV